MSNSEVDLECACVRNTLQAVANAISSKAVALYPES